MGIMELGAIGELVGGLAVIATLVYLAIQVRHSNRMAESSLYDKTQEAWPLILRPAIDEMDVFVRGVRNYRDLDEGDAFKFGMIISVIFGYYENFYLKGERTGLIGREELERLDRHIIWLVRRPGIGQGFWSDFRHLFTDTFARHIDTIMERIARGEIADFGGDMGLRPGSEA